MNCYRGIQWFDNIDLLSLLLFAVAEDIENSSTELEKLCELMMKEGLTILLVRELSPDFWHEYPNTDSVFLTPSLAVKTETFLKNLLSP